MIKRGVYLLVFVILIQSCYAATLHGTVYDLSLEVVKDVVVEVNTTPRQRLVAKDGSYFFSLPLGTYELSAEQLIGNMTIASTTDTIVMEVEGDYVLDLFLFPNLEEDDSLYPDEPDIPEDYFRTTNYLLIVVAVLLAAVLLMLALIYFRSKRHKPVVVEVDGEDDLKKVLNIIKSQGGRTTQKEIRKHMPLSEAKVSLILTELEAKGVIEKIKKGRGNIIILKQ